MNQADETWREIADSIETLSGLANQAISPQQFHAELADRLVAITSAECCSVWTPSEAACGPDEHEPMTHDAGTQDSSNGRTTDPSTLWNRVFRKQADSGCPLGTDGEQLAATLPRVEEASKSNRAIFFPSRTTAEHGSLHPLDHDLSLVPVRVDQTTVSVIELAHRPDRSPKLRDAGLQLLSAAGEIAADYYRNWQLRALRDRESRRDGYDRFTDLIHRDYEIDRVANAIALEGRELIGCDRLSVVETARGTKVLAVSGVDTLESRSPTVASISQLMELIQDDPEAQWRHRDQTDNERRVQDYFETTGANRVGVIPLTIESDRGQRRASCIGALVVEDFDLADGLPQDLTESRSNWVARHSANALGNAISVSRIPLGRLGRWLDRNVLRGARVRWLALFACLLVASVAGLVLIQTELRIEARGALQPVRREVVFAPRAGIVTDIPAIHGSEAAQHASGGTPVRAGETLIELEDAQLDYELNTILGEQATVNQQLATNSVTLEQLGRSNDQDARDRFDELTAQSLELKVRQQSLAKRIELLKDEKAGLAIRAGISGRILSWDVTDELMLRPVQQGDRLLEVVDVEGPWELDLYVDDRHIGYVQTAASTIDQPLPISFILKSEPEDRHTAEMTSVALSTEHYPEYGSAVRVTGRLESTDELTSLRPGTTIIAKIDCGKKPLGYVWLHELVHAIRMWVLF